MRIVRKYVEFEVVDKRLEGKFKGIVLSLN